MLGRRTSNATARVFSDTDGVLWRVREWQIPERPPALYFESEHAFRRVTRYPNDWRELPTGELEILSHET